MGFVEEIEQATATVADGVGPSVVRIGRHHGRGAGVVVADGAVLTNAHNVRGHETTVTFADGHRATGTVSGVDADGDLAVIAVDTAGAPAVTWRDDAVGVGAVLWSVTTVPGGGTRVTSGTVSAASRTFRGPRGRLIDAGLEH
ncbi:MAG TPA: trypsin-like peptidase domain-containing protein, partial [Acidimicrobiales bacterium]|nr:trypsin-like peptidase domain-containing protein [Acidimicrobiales bacterium]